LEGTWIGTQNGALGEKPFLASSNNQPGIPCSTHLTCLRFSMFLSGIIFVCSQSGHHPWEDLAKSA
jgi:hypothetical protein